MASGDKCLYRSEESALLDRIRGGDVPIAVYGLGKMGLPLAAVLADRTGNVTGVDIDQKVVNTVNEGRSHVHGEPGLQELVADCVARNALRATSAARRAATEAAIHVIIVPTLLTESHDPDLSMLQAAIEQVGSGLDRGDLVVIESTIPPRSCSDVVEPLLCETSGLETDAFNLAFCPERTSSGRAIEDITGAYPKVVGGIDEESSRAAAALYEVVNDAGVHRVTDATTAETVKVLEGVYRDVNIALANELATMADEIGVDVNEAIRTANQIPFCDIHSPGPGVGGHCIPYYPYFLISPFETPTDLLETARTVNDRMPGWTVERTIELMEAESLDVDSATVLVAGLTYRPGIDEIRAAPSLDISRRLDQVGATILLCDPVLSDFSPFPGTPVELTALPNLDVDAVVLVTPHDEFASIDWNDLAPAVVVDGRQSLDANNLDANVYTIGTGSRPQTR